MNSRQFLAVLVLAASAVAPLRASERSEYTYRPISVSFFPPLSTNGLDARSTSSSFSFNIIGGLLGELRGGVELGSVFNIEQGDAQGYQAAGAFNYVGRDVRGLQMTGGASIVGNDLYFAQFAGGANLVARSVFGAQFAGGANIAGSDLAGGQFTGGANIVGRNASGAQCAGGANIVAGEMIGLQLAGGMNLVAGNGRGAQIGSVNIADALAGTQVGTTNIAGHMAGSQLGVVNIANRMNGFQLGVVNIADKLDGEALGLVSIIGDGQFHINVWYDETAPVNVGIKAGSKRIYNIYALGLKPGGAATNWLTGLGLGGHVPLDPFFVDIDAVGFDVRQGVWWDYSGLNLLNRARLTGGWQIAPKIALTLGVSLNVDVTTDVDRRIEPILGYRFFDLRSGDVYVRGWPGFSVGLQLM